MKIPELPVEINNILDKYRAPERLVRHLRIVLSVASFLLKEFKTEWNLLSLNEELILFGAATHDIGKVIEEQELYHPGKKHELAGMKLLIENGFRIECSRFANSHANWNQEENEIEDLIITLADKIWKGKRIFELEEELTKRISNQLSENYWEIHQKLDEIIEKVVVNAQERINWQNKVD